MGEPREAASNPKIEPDAAEGERRLGRTLALAIPLMTIASASAVGVAYGLGPAVLVFGGGGLLGTIAFLWASLRTLTGDAPLPEKMEALTFRRSPVTELEERKRRVLRALKDLDAERRYGKIDEADYKDLAAKYREEAKDVLREQDLEVEPFLEKAEALAREHLKKRGLDGAKKRTPLAPPPKKAEPEDSSDDVATAKGDGGDDDQDPLEPSQPDVARARVDCPKCAVSNEADAAFCKKCGHNLTASAGGSEA